MRISRGESQEVYIEAPIIYGGSPVIEVHGGEIYSFEASKGKTWKDWFIPSSAKGFFNPLLELFPSMKRVRSARCFELCGTIDKDEEHHFRIGKKLASYEITKSGMLFFFPNDSEKHYKNNRGFMKVTVSRIS